MNNHEKTKDMVNEYVRENGTSTEMTKAEFIEWLQTRYPNINKQNVYPSDMSFNRYNAGLVDFPGPLLCLMYIEENDTYRLVGTDFKPDGPVYQYKNRKNERIVGRWENGKFSFEDNYSYGTHI